MGLKGEKPDFSEKPGLFTRTIEMEAKKRRMENSIRRFDAHSPVCTTRS
jgi:hypothetical protein